LGVYLFTRALTDIRDVENPRLRVDREPPRIPQAFGPKLPPPAGLSHERIVGWNRVGISVVHVEAHQRAEQRVEVLTVPERIATSAAVTKAGVKHRVGAKCQEPAVVILVGAMRDREYQLRCRGIGELGVVGHGGEALDTYFTEWIEGREADVEEPVSRVLRMERDAEHSPLAPARYAVPDVEEGGRLQDAVLDDLDPPRLHDDENAPVVERLGQESGTRESGAG
jgi:hypothetical protein